MTVWGQCLSTQFALQNYNHAIILLRILTTGDHSNLINARLAAASVETFSFCFFGSSLIGDEWLSIAVRMAIINDLTCVNATDSLFFV